jgi:exopolyphosphatase/pppGpp-phosphohydrolase
MTDTSERASSRLHEVELGVVIHDDHTELVTADGTRHVIPVGPVTLTATEFGQVDPPPPSCLTNALGLVHDHVDDIIAATPDIALVSTVAFSGHHARALAQIEIGDTSVPPVHRVRRGDIDDVFRTVVVETAAERHSNPGLDDDHVDTIIATCCTVLAIMRRFALIEATFVADAGAAERH